MLSARRLLLFFTKIFSPPEPDGQDIITDNGKLITADDGSHLVTYYTNVLISDSGADIITDSGEFLDVTS